MGFRRGFDADRVAGFDVPASQDNPHNPRLANEIAFSIVVEDGCHQPLLKIIQSVQGFLKPVTSTTARSPM